MRESGISRLQGGTAVALLHMAVLSPVMLTDGVPRQKVKTRVLVASPRTPRTSPIKQLRTISSPLSTGRSAWTSKASDKSRHIVLPAPSAEEYELAKSSKTLDFADEVSEMTRDHLFSDEESDETLTPADSTIANKLWDLHSSIVQAAVSAPVAAKSAVEQAYENATTGALNNAAGYWNMKV